jgi:hypothetical protein
LHYNVSGSLLYVTTLKQPNAVRLIALIKQSGWKFFSSPVRLSTRHNDSVGIKIVRLQKSQK